MAAEWLELSKLLLPLDLETEEFTDLPLIGLSGEASTGLSPCVHL
jgi:hypothetical protein